MHSRPTAQEPAGRVPAVPAGDGRVPRAQVGTTLTAAEALALGEIRAALLRCEEGLDDGVMRAVKEALLRVTHFDQVALSLVDESNGSFCVLFYDALPSSPPPAFHTGLRMLTAQNRASDVCALDPLVRPSIDPTRPVEAALHAVGVQSYVSVPLERRGTQIGALTLAHLRPGAPSQKALPLLVALADDLSPALVRMLSIARGRIFEALVEGAPEGMLALDRNGVVMHANAAGRAMLERPLATLVGHALADVVGGPASVAIQGALAAPEGGNAVTIEATLKGGRTLALDAMVATVAGSSEARFQVHLRDAEARRAVELATARRVSDLAFLRDLGDALAGDLQVIAALERVAAHASTRPEVLGILSFRALEEGGVRFVTAQATDPKVATRLAREADAELRAMLAVSAQDHRRLRDRLATFESAGEAPGFRLLVPLEHARRSLGVLLVVGRPGGRLLEVDRELWERVAATVSASLHAAVDFEHLVALEAEKRQLVDNLPVIVARIDPRTGSTLFVNGAFERILGYTNDEVAGGAGLESLILDPVEWEASAVARDRAARGLESSWQERRYRHKDGRPLTLRESVYPVLDPAGSVRAIEVIAYDVTSELESRKQVMQADRLASLGSLAAGIAHEINNPTAFIQLAAGHLEKIMARGAAGVATQDALTLTRELSEAAARISNIVGELKLFTRIPEGAVSTPADVNRIVQMAVTLTSSELRQRARLEITLGELPLVPGDFARLGQAFVNLLLNAAQAVQAKRSDGPNFVRVSTFAEANTIVVRVSDTGVGIEPRHLPRIFDPFFKNKPGGEGAGLGLAIAYELVQRVGGDIHVASQPGEGSTFDVVLPTDGRTLTGARRAASSGALRAAPSVQVARCEASPRTARGRVLIVEDELSLARALARQISERYDVETVSTAGDALAELSLHTYDVVVCDLRMPDECGPALYERLLARSPRQAARFVFTTGGSYGQGDDEIHERAVRTGRPILEKPFDGASFDALIAEVAQS